MLSDVREKMVRSLDITLHIDQLSRELIERLERYTVAENGKLLKFCVRDPDSQTEVKLFSRNRHINLSDELMTYLQEEPGFEFRLT